MKDKTNSIRTYDRDGCRRRAACLCFKDSTEQEVLLVSSSLTYDKWIVPGGGVEPNESYFTAAHRELLEEAGAIGKIARCLGAFVNDSTRKTRTVVYVVILDHLLENWQEKSQGRRRRWFKTGEAIEHLRIHRLNQCSYFMGFSKGNNNNSKLFVSAPPESTRMTDSYYSTAAKEYSGDKTNNETESKPFATLDRVCRRSLTYLTSCTSSPSSPKRYNNHSTFFHKSKSVPLSTDNHFEQFDQ